MEAYITDIACFLPNNPVDNEQIEELLGMVGHLPSRTRKIILRNNGIKERYYAIDPKTGQPTHSNAQLTAEAIKRLQPNPDFHIKDIEVLCCGTSAPDQLMPSHASMVHGELANGPMEVASTAGICLAGTSALKYVATAVAAKTALNGVATGSENASSFFRPGIFAPSGAEKADELAKSPQLGFEADFLRWMLSDGAGACFIEQQKSPDRLSLRIDWIESASHAHRLEPCMYAGAIKQADGTLRGWRDFSSLPEAVDAGALPVKQDVKLLNDEIIPVIIHSTLPPLVNKYGLKTSEINWFLPHYSSEYFRNKVYEGLQEIDFEIEQNRWFTNLASKGNTGSASIYIIMEELFHSGKLKRGDTLLCMIPESGRFACGYMHLTAV